MTDTGAPVPPPARSRAIGVLGVLVIIMAIPILATAGSSGFAFLNTADDGPRAVVRTASPGALDIHTVDGRNTPPPVQVTLDGDDGLESVSASVDARWLELSVDGLALSASVSSDGLEPGIYSATIEVEPGDVEIPVSLQVHEPVGQQHFAISPEQLAIEIEATEEAPQDLQFEISAADDESAEWRAVTSAEWLQLSTYSGVAPSTVSISIDADRLTEGTNAGKVWIGGTSLNVQVEVSGSDEPSSDAGAPEATATEIPDETTPEPTPPLSADTDMIAFAATSDGLSPPGKSLKIDAEGQEPVSWSAEASEPWIVLSESSGTTPQTIWIGADVESLEPGEHSGTVTVGDLEIPIEVVILAEAQADPAFDTVRDRLDLPVENGTISRTWLWGPEPLGTFWERFDDAPGGERLVQYYDKARLEVTYPDADEESDWYVTTGLLVLEMIGGEIQVGEDAYLETTPANIPVAGDADDDLGPRYASFQEHLDAAPLQAGSTVTQVIDAEGNVQDNPAMAGYDVRVTGPHAVTGHTIASVFWDYLNDTGIVYEDGFTAQGPLFDPWFYATGLPITEPYWAEVTANGEVVDILIQCFERRCLTYTPSYEAAWQVEQGNVGLHYFRWRYENSGIDARDLAGSSAIPE